MATRAIDKIRGAQRFWIFGVELIMFSEAGNGAS
jgi:hypothetical protein